MTRLPKVKTSEEIKRGLECYTEHNACEKHPKCNDCPFKVYSADDVLKNEPIRDALRLIRQLEAENSRKDDTIRNLTELLNAAHEDLADVKRERDAAVADMRKMAISHIPCDVCSNDHQSDPICKSHQGDCSECSVHCPCDGCFDDWEMELTGNNFAWRGVCPDTKVRSDD